VRGAGCAPARSGRPWTARGIQDEGRGHDDTQDERTRERHPKGLGRRPPPSPGRGRRLARRGQGGPRTGAIPTGRLDEADEEQHQGHRAGQTGPAPPPIATRRPAERGRTRAWPGAREGAGRRAGAWGRPRHRGSTGGMATRATAGIVDPDIRPVEEYEGRGEPEEAIGRPGQGGAERTRQGNTEARIWPGRSRRGVLLHRRDGAGRRRR